MNGKKKLIKYFLACLLIVLALSLTIFPLLLRNSPKPTKTGAQELTTNQKDWEEDSNSWSKVCNEFTDGVPLTTCPTQTVTINTENKQNGAHSTSIKGSRTKLVKYQLSIPVKPSTRYKISGQFQVENRQTYNYLDYNYPSSFTKTDPNVRTFVEITKGIWSGTYAFQVNNVSMLPVQTKDGPYRSASFVPWFGGSTILTTADNQTTLSLRVILTGFDGNFLIDNIQVIENPDTVEDRYLHIPITYEYSGMKIKNVSENPLIVETNAVRYGFSDQAITIEKDGEKINEVRADSSIFTGLSVKKEDGTVYLENDKVAISIGADSVIILKSKQNGLISILGSKKPFYSNFEAGIIFTTDGDKGILVSPIRSKNDIQAMTTITSSNLEFSYLDSDFEKSKTKTWNVVSPLDNNSWQIDYTLTSGNGLIIETFPAKTFDNLKYCTNRSNLLQVNTLNINSNNTANIDYALQKFREHSNIGIVWMHEYAQSATEFDPPEEYCQDKDLNYVSCNSSNVAKRTPLDLKIDPSGPYVVANPDGLRTLVEKAHKNNIRLVMYMSPNLFYTTDVDTVLSNISKIINEYNLDGVYYDGYNRGEALQTLELARKTRNLLRDKIFIQHSSISTELIKISLRFRQPFADVHADIIWNGEGAKAVDDNTWEFNYCGKNVSNTPSLTLAELRPVNRNLSNEESVKLSLTAEQQVDKLLACGGQFHINQYKETTILTDKATRMVGDDLQNSYYWNAYDSKCLPVTCGNNICDPGESIFTCGKDCATPSSTTISLNKNGSTAICSTNQSVAQWTIAGQPFYTLHFNFNDAIISDVSGNKMNPYAITDKNYKLPQPQSIDGKATYYFDGNSSFSSEHSNLADFTNKTFSSFAHMKRNGSDQNKQTIFNLNPSQHFSYGIADSKLTVTAIDASGTLKTFTGSRTIDPNWHTVGIIYEKPKLKIYIDNILDQEFDITIGNFPPTGEYTVGGLSYTNHTADFKGYIDDLFLTQSVLTDKQIEQYSRTQLKELDTEIDNLSCLSYKDGKFNQASINLIFKAEDINKDNKIDILDYGLLIINYGKIGNVQGDINKDGKVDIQDYNILLAKLQ